MSWLAGSVVSSFVRFVVGLFSLLKSVFSSSNYIVLSY